MADRRAGAASYHRVRSTPATMSNAPTSVTGLADSPRTKHPQGHRQDEAELINRRDAGTGP